MRPPGPILVSPARRSSAGAAGGGGPNLSPTRPPPTAAPRPAPPLLRLAGLTRMGPGGRIGRG
ncbi:hypothetical protein, partial [Nocardia wallacei]|uniref:hypothetical protein n=1 Tax=Nocardia wallacei TaxID=480035 RepID=UPI0024537711